MTFKLRCTTLIMFSFFLLFIYLTSNDLPTTSTNSNARAGESIQNIFFMNVHNFASSTIQNILMRYGDNYQLNFALPYNDIYFGHPQSFQSSMAISLASPEQLYNVFCHHCRFNESGAEQIFPTRTSVYVTIIGDPAETFETMYETYGLSAHYEMSLEEFVSMPLWWYNTCPRQSGRLGTNQIAFDFGMEEKDFADYPKVIAYIKDLERVFDLVLIAEHLEESVILLKHLLKLRIQDVVYVALNKQLSGKKSNSTKNMADALRKINHVDQMIYEHFTRVFHQKVQRFDKQKMASEIEELRKNNNNWAHFCGIRKANTSTNTPLILAPDNNENMSTFVGKNKEKSQKMCKYLTQSELEFTKQLRKKHVQNNLSLWSKFLYLIGYNKY